MSKLPAITGEKAVKAFQKAGFCLVSKKRGGSHRILKKMGHKYHLSIPVHKGKILGKGLLRRLLRDAEMTEEQFRGFL